MEDIYFEDNRWDDPEDYPEDEETIIGRLRHLKDDWNLLQNISTGSGSDGSPTQITYDPQALEDAREAASDNYRYILSIEWSE